jgi:predicted ATP-grasp superfamily ATP-dependent carboligase
MAETPLRLIIAGVSTRALALSAAAAGHRVTAIDAFGDLDLRAAADVIALRREGGAVFTPTDAANAARSIAADAVAYTSNFENHPEAVRSLASGRRLLGNAPDVLARVRSPLLLMRLLRARGFRTPATRASAPAGGGRWLLKPRRSGGGHGTSAWRAGRAISRRAYLQERIDGRPGSIVFLADGRRAVPLGLTRQLVGEPAFGASGFRYCGSLLAVRGARLFDREDEIRSTAMALAEAVTELFGLRGLNGLDFIARGGVPYPIEVNPRYSASMELIERASGLSLFSLHARACAGILPAEPAAPRRVHGKAIVYARRDAVVGDSTRWAVRGARADVPHPGERIGRGHPICTVFADGVDAERCQRGLIAAAGEVYRATAGTARGAA